MAESQEWLRTAMRRIAYDFHWGDNREDFLSRLDPKKTAQVLSDAGVQMLQLCAKSHWGLSIYPTKVGKQHPNLRGRDYFGQVLAALNAKGIKCMAYFSDYWDMHAGRTHPEWRFLTSAQSRGEEPVREGWWWTLCPETGYNDYLIAQMVEVAERYPLAGIFIDMVGFMGYCYCPSCRPKFQRDTGHEIPEKENWSSPLWRRFIEWRYRETERILKQRRQAVLAAHGDLVFSHNYHGNCYHYYGLSHEPVEAHGYADYFTTESSPWDFAFGLQGGSQAAKFARGAAPIAVRDTTSALSRVGFGRRRADASYAKGSLRCVCTRPSRRSAGMSRSIPKCDRGLNHQLCVVSASVSVRATTSSHA